MEQIDTRCANEPINSFPLYLHSLLFCLIGKLRRISSTLLMKLYTETILLHSSIIISTFLITKFFPTKFPPALHLIPLTLFYSCIPTLFILCISTLIYPSEYISDFEWTTKTSINLSDYSFSPPFMLLLSLLKKLGRSELKLKISRIGGIWAEETLVRKLVGGSSAIVGLSALIGSKGKTIVVLSLGWIIHLIFLNLLDGIFI